MFKLGLWRLALPVLVLLNVGAAIVYAQSTGPTLSMEAEQPIGAACPLASTVQAETNLLWVLLADNCSGLSSLQAYDLSTFEPREQVAVDVASLRTNAGEAYPSDASLSIFAWMMPFAITPNGEFVVYATRDDSDDLFSVRLDPQTGELFPRTDEDERLNAFVRQFSEYPGYSVNFSPDHTYAAVMNDEGTMLSIVDLASESLLFEAEGERVQASFAPDNARVYVSGAADPADSSSSASVLSVYRLPDGDLLAQHELPMSGVYPSADGRLAALVTDRFEDGTFILGFAELSALDLDTGSSSAEQLIGTGPQPVTTCVNTGDNVSDLSLTTEGDLPLIGLHWLPDSRQFVTVNSHGGQFYGNCLLEVSRLRLYSVGQ